MLIYEVVLVIKEKPQRHRAYGAAGVRIWSPIGFVSATTSGHCYENPELTIRFPEIDRFFRVGLERQ